MSGKHRQGRVRMGDSNPESRLWKKAERNDKQYGKWSEIEIGTDNKGERDEYREEGKELGIRRRE